MAQFPKFPPIFGILWDNGALAEGPEPNLPLNIVYLTEFSHV